MTAKKMGNRRNVDPRLEELLSTLEQLSQWEKLRSEHEQHRTEITNNGNGPCATCGRSKGEYEIRAKEETKVRVVAAAHIKPAEEGGRGNPANLLPLCERGQRSLEKAGGDSGKVGCHQLYDEEGFFRRDNIRKIQQAWQQGRVRKRNQPQVRQKEQTLKEKVEHNIERGQVGEKTLGEINQLLHKAGNDRVKRIEAFLLKLRCVRRSRRKDRVRELKRVQHDLDVEYAALLRDFRNTLRERNILESVEYEIGMVRHFDVAEFIQANEWFRRYKRAPGSDGGWMINELQACVADYETLREQTGLEQNSSSRPMGVLGHVKQICGRMDSVVNSVDVFLADHPEAKKRKILSRWRVTARLHLVRMLAFARDRRCEQVLREAIEIRDSQDFKTGWAWYTTALMLHSEGECYRCLKRWSMALKTLSLGARWIILKKYKNYEYLDNVLSGLLVLRQNVKDFSHREHEVIRRALRRLPEVRR